MQLACLATDGATISRVVEGFIKLDKLYAKTYSSCSMLYDEMYIDLQHILLVITEFGFAKMLLKCFFYMNSVRTSRMILNVTEVHVFIFKPPPC